MFSRTTEYALRAALYLAKYGGANSTAQQIAGMTQVPEGYMAKVLNTLVRAGLVSSQRGPTGGFQLAFDPEKMTILDIVEAVEPLPRFERQAKPCGMGAWCPVSRLLEGVVATTAKSLGSTTIADLARAIPMT